MVVGLVGVAALMSKLVKQGYVWKEYLPRLGCRPQERFHSDSRRLQARPHFCSYGLTGLG